MGLLLVQSNQSTFLVTDLQCQYLKGYLIQGDLEKHGNLFAQKLIADQVICFFQLTKGDYPIF